MINPISLRLRNAETISKARATIARVDEDARLRRRTKLAAVKALLAVRRAYELEEKTSFRFMGEVGQKRWRERRKSVEAELKRIAGLYP
jgi:tRNA(Ile2) C34 agmatinyltransferase TiaS